MSFPNDLRQDVLYGLRGLIRSPEFAAVGIVSLGLAIGTDTTIFSQLNALLLRELPGATEPQDLVSLQGSASYPYFERYRDQKGLFAGAAAYVPFVPFNVTLDGAASGKPERIYGHLVSAEYFSVLGVRAARGRMLHPDIDKPGQAPVVVVSERFWRTRLESDPRAVGRTLRINGQLATIVGVGPKDFLGVGPYPTPADLFVPVTVGERAAPELGDNVLHNRDVRMFRVLMRVAPGVGMPSAQAALDTITRQMDQESVSLEKDRKGPRVQLMPGGRILQLDLGNLRAQLVFAGVLMGLILTIACMNLATMLLARASGRRKELAIRLAVGAGRFRILRQMLTESVLLGACGGVAGALFAYLLARLFGTIKVPVQIPIEIDQLFRPDWRVVLFITAISILSGLGFGLAPALAATKADVAPALKQGAISNLRAYRRFGFRNFLVVYQVAGSLMLLMIAGFLVIGLNRSSKVTVGADDNGLYLLSLDPMHDGYPIQKASEFFEKLPERLAGLGTVHGVALSEVAPLSPVQVANTAFTLPATADAPAQLLSGAATNAIGAAYFSTLGMPLLRGREFTQRDGRAEPGAGVTLPAILSESAARGLFRAADPMGRRITSENQAYEVVGLARDIPAVFSASSVPVVYVPLTRRNFAHPAPFGLTLLVRGAAGPGTLEGIRHVLTQIDPNLSVFNVHTLREQLDQTDAYLKFAGGFYAGIGMFGLILASVGLGGVTAYSVARRRKELGIRMALGSGPGQAVRLVLREGTALVLVGSLIGYAGAVALTRVLSTTTEQIARIFQAGTRDPLLLIGAPLLLAGLAMLACYLPARKITKIDPLVALREE